MIRFFDDSAFTVGSMTDRDPADPSFQSATPDGPRAILRVPEVLIAVSRQGKPFSQLCSDLGIPKATLHRILRTLENGGYLIQRSGHYFLGPASARLADELNGALPPTEFPRSVRPILEWLARETKESIILAILTDGGEEVSYIDVINSEIPLRFTVPLGNRRPLYAAASGQAILAFLSREAQERYMANTDFIEFTSETMRRENLPAKLRETFEQAVVFDRNGSFSGASAIASPCFDRTGSVRCAISIAGPTERLERVSERLTQLSREAGERISRSLGYAGPYPPRP